MRVHRALKSNILKSFFEAMDDVGFFFAEFVKLQFSSPGRDASVSCIQKSIYILNSSEIQGFPANVQCGYIGLFGGYIALVNARLCASVG